MNLRAALIQLNSGDDPDRNLAVTAELVERAANSGAGLVLTPEITNCVSSDRAHQRAVLHPEGDDPTLAALREQAARLRIWLLIGSLALRTGDTDGRLANRSFLIDPDGAVVARYDKIHMFDVTVSSSESYRESDAFRPGNRAVVAQTAFGKVGLSICYDLRFPGLYQALARGGAQILTVPAAFTAVTGAAHWVPLLRARAIETGCYVLAPAQTGSHGLHEGRERRTFGHSLAVSPWGEVLVEGGEAVGVFPFEIDLGEVADARRRIPVLTHARDFEGP